MRKKRADRGFTLIELLVSMGIFSVISLGVVSYMGDAFRRIHIENKSALYSQELRNALNLIASELRMSSNISPYLPGSDVNLQNCFGFVSANANTLKFVVTHDDDNSESGVNPTYVGYVYDSGERELRRGVVDVTNYNSCSLPATDPINDSETVLLADNIIQVDSNEDGTLDDVFSLNGNTLTINLGYETTGAGGVTLNQNMSTDILIRAN